MVQCKFSLPTLFSIGFILFSVSLQAMDDCPMDQYHSQTQTLKELALALRPGISALQGGTHQSIESRYFQEIFKTLRDESYSDACAVARSLWLCSKISGVGFDKNTYFKAAYSAHSDVFKVLLETCTDKAAYLSCVDDNGKTLLMYAASELMKGNTDENRAAIVNYVLNNAGISSDNIESLVFAQNLNGQTALHEAAKNGLEKVVSVLLAWAQKEENRLWRLLSMQDKSENTALHFAARYGTKGVVTQLLSAAGVNSQAYIDMPNTEGHTARDYWTCASFTVCWNSKKMKE